MSDVLQRAQRFLTQAVTENLGLKLIAFLIALLLFTLVRFQEESERSFDVEIDPILPEQVRALELTSDLPRTVRLRLRGPSSVINALKPGDIPPYVIDLQDRQLGTSYYYFTEEKIEKWLEESDIGSRLQFVNVLRVTPESLFIKMEKLVSRALPIKVMTVGNLEPGTELVEAPEVSPSKVAVVGPASAVRDLKSIETETVSLDGLGVGEHVQVVAVNRLEGVSIRHSGDIRVTVKVRWTPGERVLSRLPVNAQGTELAAEFKPREVTVELAGPQVALNALEPSKIKPVVVLGDQEASRPGAYTGDVTVGWLPEDVKVTSIEPAQVRVALKAAGPQKLQKSKNNEGKP